ncbi:hypothetical protein NUW54_g3105 [Trametes sanguinea]|uniref:Uncharacterized protein n=1 Tax=Trametes sanguinea TaxID=158606 RepID=A0ACC1Q3B8_9APHY|nr:hypothetical protein NUW54_g3105 [Trametes sanguinea]
MTACDSDPRPRCAARQGGSVEKGRCCCSGGIGGGTPGDRRLEKTRRRSVAVRKPDDARAMRIERGRSVQRVYAGDVRRGAAPEVPGDIILPLMIFAVVKANPPHLVSHLLYTQRFRRERAAGGEEGYCLVNLMAVAEFLENVDLAALGLGESEKMVIRHGWAVLLLRPLQPFCFSSIPRSLTLMSIIYSTAELSPIPINRAGSDSGSPRVPQASLRGRVEQQVDALAGSANKVLTGVVDTSFGVLRALLPGQTSDAGVATPPVDADQGAAPWNIPQPRCDRSLRRG